MPINFVVKAAITAGAMAAQVAIGAMRKIEGPRLSDRAVSIAEYGAAIRRFWGLCLLEGCPMPWAEDLKERKKKSKTKSGKYAEYKYYGTWFSVIADHEIEAVTAIKLDKHLALQLKGPGPITSLITASTDDAGNAVQLSAKNFAIVLGTEDQLPHPRMEAWYEDHPNFGPDMCPAHRGISGVYFIDIPLEKFGNRIPQVDIEAARTKTPAYPYTSLVCDGGNSRSFAINGSWMAYYENAGAIQWWDLATQTALGTSPGPGVLSGSVSNIALANDGTAYYLGIYTSGVDAYMAYYEVGVLGVPVRTVIGESQSDWNAKTTRVFDVNGNRTVLTATTAGYFAGATFVADSVSHRDYCVDNEGTIWALTQPRGASSTTSLLNMTTLISYDFTTTARSDIATARVCFVASTNRFFVVTNSNFYLIDADTMTIVGTGSAPWGSADILPTNDPYRTSIWNGTSEYSLIDGSLIRSISLLSFVGEDSFKSTYDPITHALISRPQFISHLTWRYLDRVSSEGVTLQTIVESVGDDCNVSIAAPDLDQIVLEYSVTPGPGKDMIAPLLDIHHSILRLHDFGVEGIKRSTTSLGVIPTSAFVREGDEKAYRTSEGNATELPLRITVSYADWTKGHQANNVNSTRDKDAVDTRREQQIDMSTYGDTPNDFQAKSDRFLRWMWNSRWTVENALTAQYQALEPGDVYTLELDGELWDCEAELVTHMATTPRLDVKWHRTFPALATLGSQDGPNAGGRDDDEIFVSGPAKGFVLDIPLTDDADNDINPILYMAVGGYGAGSFAGGGVYEEDEQIVEVRSDQQATWGYTTTTLATANPNLWDRGNTVSVNVNGTLATVTEADIDEDPELNMIALKSGDDWELLNFTTATLTGTSGSLNTYTLSGFKRGRRGTEWAIAGHSSNDDFVMVSSLLIAEQGLSEVGSDMEFHATTYGRDPELAPEIDVSFEGQSLKPYAPARVKWTTDGTDLFGEIIRRTRVGGSWNGGSTIPLSENSEAYEVDVYNGVTFKRTISATTNTFTITAAMLSADGLSLTSRPNVQVYQISDTVGRGFALAA